MLLVVIEMISKCNFYTFIEIGIENYIKIKQNFNFHDRMNVRVRPKSVIVNR